MRPTYKYISDYIYIEYWNIGIFIPKNLMESTHFKYSLIYSIRIHWNIQIVPLKPTMKWASEVNLDYSASNALAWNSANRELIFNNNSACLTSRLFLTAVAPCLRILSNLASTSRIVGSASTLKLSQF